MKKCQFTIKCPCSIPSSVISSIAAWSTISRLILIELSVASRSVLVELRLALRFLINSHLATLEFWYLVILWLIRLYHWGLIKSSGISEARSVRRSKLLHNLILLHHHLLRRCLTNILLLLLLLLDCRSNISSYIRHTWCWSVDETLVSLFDFFLFEFVGHACPV